MEADYVRAYPDLYRRHWWWQVRKHIVTEEIRRIVQGGAKPIRILDVGCGAGLFFDVLKTFGDVEGIESDRAAVDSSGPWRSHITLGELDEAYRPKEPFHLILLLDVLEHVSAPESLLRRAARILHPEGRILITVPAFKW
jgi:2-polyprenyl-3-methyl-5-hydroxy-6-metoxy-1,4-benzoquinol methylase